MLFCGNSQRVKLVGCFPRGAPLLMFDGILNVTLPGEVSTTRITQGNLELPLLLILLIHVKHKNDTMKSCTNPMSSFPSRRSHPLGR